MNKLTLLELKKLKKWAEKQPPPPRVIIDGKEYIVIPLEFSPQRRGKKDSKIAI